MEDLEEDRQSRDVDDAERTKEVIDVIDQGLDAAVESLLHFLHYCIIKARKQSYFVIIIKCIQYHQRGTTCVKRPSAERSTLLGSCSHSHTLRAPYGTQKGRVFGLK